MKGISQKLEKLTSITGIDFNSETSSYRKILLEQPDPDKLISQLSYLISQLSTEFSKSEFPSIIKHKFDKQVFKQLAVLFSNSPILFRYLSKSPRSFLDIFPIPKATVEEYRIQQEKILSRFLNDLKENQEEENQFYRLIREEKVRQFLTISVADYTKMDTFEETITKITLFAETAIIYALEFSGLTQIPLAVIAMGKLGGRELNYNSDIDLMFVSANNYSEVIETKILTRRIHRFIDILDRVTADGFVFKVDLRVRPEGDQGSLYLSLCQYERYYQTRAQSWEFQALIKARMVGGDSKVGKEFETFRKRFVFNSDFSSQKMLFSIARIKSTIETFHHSRNYADVKLSPGGIRDIEFMVQFLQIHHGKITRVLSNSNTLSTLDKFLAYKLISLKQHRDFKNHYCFLRQIEHYLQLIDLQPVRKIPDDTHSLKVISRIMGFKDPEKFQDRVKKVMNYNRNLFVRIFKLTVTFHEKIEGIRKQIQSQSDRGESENRYSTFFETHIDHLESDYFLNFDIPVIIEHIQLLKQLIENQSHLEFSLNFENSDLKNSSKNKIGKVCSSLVIYDHPGIFSLICAIFSGYGISIQNGASFLYQPDDSVSEISLENSHNISIQYRSSPKAFFNQSFWEKPGKELNAHLSKKVVFFMEGYFIHEQAHQEFDKLSFKEVFLDAISQVRMGKYAQVMEGLLLKSIKSMKKYGLQSPVKQLKPIHLQVDNETHPLYTLIDIKSEDSFLFLFFFSYALSYKGYYIIKVEFSTFKNRVLNRLFLTDRKREKVISEVGILELKSSILIIKYFSAFMAYAPNPSLAYKTFNRLIEDIGLTESRYRSYYKLFRDLAKVLGTGEVIMEDFLRVQHGDIQALLSDKKGIKIPLTPEYLKKKMFKDFKKTGNYNSIETLNKFKDKFLFQLDLRLLTGEIRFFEDFCSEMTYLTDVVMTQAIEIAFYLSREKFQEWFKESEPGRHAVIALGKWGSREMGYASDVELVFIYDGPRDSDGKILSLVRDFYVYLGNQIPKIIQSKKNGVFEIDLRLRPGGDAGVIAVSLDRYRSYYNKGGGYLNYEKMVLSRLRVISDTGNLGEEILAIKDNFVYELRDFDLKNYFLLRQKQIDHLIQSPKIKKETSSLTQILHLKFSPGGLAEIEYLFQMLSICYGKDYLKVRKNNTLEIAQALLVEDLIDKLTYDRLMESYHFFRNLINCIRIIRGNAKDMLITERNSLEMEYLERTMVSFRALEEDKDLFEELHRIIDQVTIIYNKLIVQLDFK